MQHRQECTKDNLFDTIEKVAKMQALKDTVFDVEVDGLQFEMVVKTEDNDTEWITEKADSESFSAEQKARLLEILSKDKDLNDEIHAAELADRDDPDRTRYVRTEEEFMKIYNEARLNERA